METVLSPSPVEKKIEFSIPAKSVNLALDVAIKEYGKDLALDGFRKGKVPAHVIESRFEAQIHRGATDQLTQNAISQALDKHNLNPVSVIRLENPEAVVRRDMDFSFVCFFEVLPEIPLPEDLTQLTVEVPAPELTVEEMDKATRALRRHFSAEEEVQREVREEDKVLVDVQGSFEGKPIPTMQSKNMFMDIQEGSPAPEVDALLRGMKPGEEKSGELVCQDDFPEAEYRGKTIDITVHLHKILERKLPELNDEFAQKLGLKSMAELKDALLKQTMNHKLKDIKAHGQEKLLNQVMEGLDYPLPPSMLAANLNKFLLDAKRYFIRSGMEKEEAEKKLEEVRGEGEQQAQEIARRQTFLMALGYRENIQISEKELDEEIHHIAPQAGSKLAEFKQFLLESGQMDDLRERMLAEKTYDYLYSKAKKIVVDKDGNPVPAPEVKK